MKKVKLHIASLIQIKNTPKTYNIVLQDTEGKRFIEIVVGANEGQAIALGLENIKTTRPLTHDLFKNFASEFNIEITEVIINDLIDNIFYAKLICTNGLESKEIDARASDAIALSTRFNTSIYIKEHILSAVGMPIESITPVELLNQIILDRETHENNLDSLSNEALNQKLDLSIKEEDYESAAEIKKIIDKRKNMKNL